MGPTSEPSRDLVWWIGWIVILAQIGIAIPPWVLYGNWGVMMVTLWGNILAMVTCTLPQWTEEKWAGRKLDKDKVICLTRGNGSLNVMVFIGSKGSWDLESLARATSVPRPETRWVLLTLVVLWTGLLISVSGLKEDAWFLLGIGAIGMLHNFFAAGVSREPAASGFHFTKFARAPTMIGTRQKSDDDDDNDADIDLEKDRESLAILDQWMSKKSNEPSNSQQKIVPMPPWLNSMSKEDGVPEWLESIKPGRVDLHVESTRQSIGASKRAENHQVIYAAGVHGALMELEKWVPTAGLAMLQVFFPSGLSYDDQTIRDNVHKKFWKRAFYTKTVRRMAEEKRMAKERREVAQERMKPGRSQHIASHSDKV